MSFGQKVGATVGGGLLGWLGLGNPMGGGDDAARDYAVNAATERYRTGDSLYFDSQGRQVAPYGATQHQPMTLAHANQMVADIKAKQAAAVPPTYSAPIPSPSTPTRVGDVYRDGVLVGYRMSDGTTQGTAGRDASGRIVDYAAADRAATERGFGPSSNITPGE